MSTLENNTTPLANKSSELDSGSSGGLYFVVICMVIKLCGIIGNILAFIVLRRSSSKTSNIIYLQALSIGDGLFLFTVLLYDITNILQDCFQIEYHGIETFMFFIYSTQGLAYWFLVLVVIDRYIAICRPLQAITWCTKSKAYKVIIATISLILLSSIARSIVRSSFFEVVFIAQNVFIPCCLLFFFNMRVIFAIKKSASTHAQLTGIQSTGTSLI